MARRDRQLHKHVLCRTAMPRPITMLGGEASKGAPRTVNSLDTTIASLVTTNGAFSGSSAARPKTSAGADRHRRQDAHEVAAHHLDDVVRVVAAREQRGGNIRPLRVV